MLIKQKSKSLPISTSLHKKLGIQDFYLGVLNKGKPAILPPFNDLEVLSSTPNEAKLLPKNFAKNSNVIDWGISLPVFYFKTNMKLHNISVTPKMVIANLDSWKKSGLHCISVVVLKNCETALSYLQGELFNMYLKESCFPDCWKVLLVVPVFQNFEELFKASLFSVVRKVFEKLVNNWLADHLEKCGLFYDFQYGFRSSLLTVDLLTVLFDWISSGF